MDEAIQLFADEENGGFFDTGNDSEALISRPKDIMDNATPAGNSVAVDVLLRLAAFTGESSYRQRADDYLQPLADIMVQHPSAFGYALGALDFALSPVKEFAIIGDPRAADTRALVDVINERYLPNSVFACASPENQEAFRLFPCWLTAPRKMVKPPPTFARTSPVRHPSPHRKNCKISYSHT